MQKGHTLVLLKSVNFYCLHELIYENSIECCRNFDGVRVSHKFPRSICFGRFLPTSRRGAGEGAGAAVGRGVAAVVEVATAGGLGTGAIVGGEIAAGLGAGAAAGRRAGAGTGGGGAAGASS